MRTLIVKEIKKLCKKFGKIMLSSLSADIDFNFMVDNLHLMDDVTLLKFYTTLVAYSADVEFKKYLCSGGD